MTLRDRFFHGSLVVVVSAAMMGCAATPEASVGRATTWAGPEAGLAQPIGVVEHPDGGLLVTDSGNNRLVRFGADGRVLDVWGERGTSPGQFRRPLGVAVGTKGRVYIADYLNDRVQVLDAQGSPLAQWTSFGTGDRFDGPADLALDDEGHVYVVEFNGSRIVKLDREGQLIQTWGSQGHGRDQLYYPTRIKVGPKQRIWVTDAYNHRLKVYSAAGELLHIIGAKGKKPGDFNVPGGVAFDGVGGFWVADFFNNRLQHFAYASGNTRRITVWRGQDNGIGLLRQPTDLAMSPDGRTLFIVDYGNNRLVRLVIPQQETTTWSAPTDRSSLGPYWD